MILATINSGIWQVNQVLTLTIDYSKRIASTYPKHRIYGFTTTQTLQPTKNNAADLNLSNLEDKQRQYFHFDETDHFLKQYGLSYNSGKFQIRKWVFLHFYKWIQSDQYK